MTGTITGTITPSAKLEIQSNYTGVITPNHPNMEQQIKVAVFLAELIVDNKVVSSKFLKEGWIRKPHNNANLNCTQNKIRTIELSMDSTNRPRQRLELHETVVLIRAVG